MEIEKQKTRKRGRPSNATTRAEKYTLSLGPDFTDWVKSQSGGLSELVHRDLNSPAFASSKTFGGTLRGEELTMPRQMTNLRRPILERRLLRGEREKSEAALDAADNQKWDESFASTPTAKLRKMAEKVRADYAAGKTRLGGFGGE